jgi:putative ABC transport system ATP-binding protein/lipoprotein-releasing system ATP-binding protein
MGIVARHVGKIIGNPPNRVLSEVSLEIQDGEFVSLTGRSGSGKSTLLYILSSLDNASSGQVEISGRDLSRMESDELHAFRNEQMGFVFQFHYLLAELTALENVMMPTRKRGQYEQRLEFGKTLCEKFGLKDKMNRLPRQLSGGEQQRVAIARALIMQPKYLYADEPTGSLDSVNGEQVMNLIIECNRDWKTTVLMVTHDPDFANLASRQIRLVDGRVS